MNNIYSIDELSKHKRDNKSLDEKQLDEATDWISRLDRGLTDSEDARFSEWLSCSPKNMSVLFEVAQMWDKLDDLNRLSDLFPQNTPTPVSKNYWMKSMAASFLLASLVGLFQFYSDDLKESLRDPSSIVAEQKIYQTDIGESSTVHLADNSKLILNTNTFVQVRYSTKARLIELQRGEIHIEVAHDSQRPLSVIAGGKIIQAIGTAFNVELRNNLVQLLVTDGKVLITEKSLDLTTENIDEKTFKLPSSSMAISKGEKIDFDLSGFQAEKVTKVAPVEIAASLSWRQGNLIFRGESLAEVMAEISRYSDVKFELDDNKQLQEIQVVGMFKTGDITGLLDVLKQNFKISHRRVSENKIFLKFAG